jgi:hypothetical protein
MTYQGTRARAADDESKRVFEVSKIRLAADGRISDVMGAETTTGGKPSCSTARRRRARDPRHGPARRGDALRDRVATR